MSNLCDRSCPVFKMFRDECKDRECPTVGLACISYGAPNTTTDCYDYCCVKDSNMIAVVAIVVAVIVVVVVACSIFIVCYCCRNKKEKKQRKSQLNRENLVQTQLDMNGTGREGFFGDEDMMSSESAVIAANDVDHVAIGAPTSPADKNAFYQRSPQDSNHVVVPHHYNQRSPREAPQHVNPVPKETPRQGWDQQRGGDDPAPPRSPPRNADYSPTVQSPREDRYRFRQDMKRSPQASPRPPPAAPAAPPPLDDDDEDFFQVNTKPTTNASGHAAASPVKRNNVADDDDDMFASTTRGFTGAPQLDTEDDFGGFGNEDDFFS
jgi:hypothetical protein